MNILFVMRDDGDMTEPMNLMLLSALAQRQGHRTNILVLEGNTVKDALDTFNPDIVAFSCITGNQRVYLATATEVKRLNPSVVTIFGGPHFTYFPGEIMRHSEAIDMICVGEGDDAWPEVLQALEIGRSPDDIRNIITRNNADRVLEMPDMVKPGFIRPRTTDLDALPFLDRALIYDNTAFRNRFKRTHMASRGCPYRCAYCFEAQFNNLYKGLGRVRQFYSVDRFLAELEYVKKNWDTRYFKFYDDVFIPFPNPGEIAWHEEFCSKYPERIGLPFHLLTRCDNVMMLKRRHGMNVIRDWKQAGLASLTMSIESGNRFIHDHVIVRDQSLHDVEDAFRLARQEGVYTFPNTIVAIPAPIVPRQDDPDFDAKLERVGKELGILQKLHRTKPDLAAALQLIKDWTPNENDAQRRRFIISMLTLFGLRHDNLTTNIESVEFTLQCQPGFAEFLTLFPYPGTKATEWCIARGDFDGDFEKLHASYQTKTPLTCYSQEEMAVIWNLTFIGTFLCLFWGSRNRLMQSLARPLTKIFVRRLSRITHPWAEFVYFCLYTISKAYMHRTRIYPMKLTLKEKLRFYGEMIQLDIWKQIKERRKLIRFQPRRLTLGGSPP